MKTMKVNKRQVLSTIVAMLVCLFVQAETGSAAQDEIVLKNGSRLIGTVTDSRDGVVTIETDFAGTLSVAMDQVESVNTAEPVVVLMEDDTVHRESSLIMKDEQLVLGDEGTAFPLGELHVVNPQPWELGQGYRWTGTFGFAIEIERGNTDTDELDVKLDTVWRSTRDRYTLKWDSEKDEANGKKTTDKAAGIAKYDYFLADPNYVGLLAFAEKDKFKDLDLRYMIGPYYGRQFYAEPIFSLSGELGISYVNEEYNVAEDQDYGASNWSLHVSSDYLGGDSSLYFDQIGIWNLEDTSDVVVNSTFGLSVPLVWNFEAAAEVLLDFDSGAAADVDEGDQTYRLRIGYTWD
jgi:putative salt-induced outer membrane protein YdiY